MKPSPSLQKTTDSIGCSVRGGIEELVVRRPDRKQCERNDGKDQRSADEPRSRSASKPSTDASGGGQQSECDLHYRCPAVTRAEDGGRYHSPAFHPRRMLCEVDVEGSARKERCCKNGYKLERGHQGLLTLIMTSRTCAATSGGCGNQIGVTGITGQSFENGNSSVGPIGAAVKQFRRNLVWRPWIVLARVALWSPRLREIVTVQLGLSVQQ
jgi:hypothetical protein